MKTAIRIAALLISGVAVVGCNDKSKDTTTVTTPSGATTTVQTPAMPPAAQDPSKADKIIDQGANAVKSEADKLMNKAPTTAPAMPTMPAMPK